MAAWKDGFRLPLWNKDVNSTFVESLYVFVLFGVVVPICANGQNGFLYDKR